MGIVSLLLGSFLKETEIKTHNTKLSTGLAELAIASLMEDENLNLLGLPLFSMNYLEVG
jgi:hypothetical protein